MRILNGLTLFRCLVLLHQELMLTLIITKISDLIDYTGIMPEYPIPSYKYGGIHIKKKNRGKFNALKKRTGKTTEELTHSKNPLTRKRAIFAQNAKKWKHKGRKKK